MSAEKSYPLSVVKSAAYGLRSFGHTSAADEAFKAHAGFLDLLKAGESWLDCADPAARKRLQDAFKRMLREHSP